MSTTQLIKPFTQLYDKRGWSQVGRFTKEYFVGRHPVARVRMYPETGYYNYEVRFSTTTSRLSSNSFRSHRVDGPASGYKQTTAYDMWYVGGIIFYEPIDASIGSYLHASTSTRPRPRLFEDSDYHTAVELWDERYGKDWPVTDPKRNINFIDWVDAVSKADLRGWY